MYPSFNIDHFMLMFEEVRETDYLFDEFDNETQGLISVVFSKMYETVYLNKPDILNKKPLYSEYFELLFDVKEFMVKVSEQLVENIHTLDKFKYIDQEIKLLFIIMEDYIGWMVDKTINITDIKVELRNLKLKKLTKIDQ
jgi:hypothetical protein